MMILEKLWNGDVSPRERQYRPNSEYRQPFRKMEECAKAIQAELSESGKRIFAEYVDAEQTAGTITECDSFIAGFRTGVLMMVDVFCPAYTKDGERV